MIQAGFRANWVFLIFVFVSNTTRTLLNLVSVSIFREYMRRFSMTPEEIEKESGVYKYFTQEQIGIRTVFIKLFEIFIFRKCNEYQTF